MAAVIEAYMKASVLHNSQNCEVCIDIDLADFYTDEANDWKARKALIKLRQILEAWHG